MTASAQLLVYGFPPGAAFEGRLAGAIQRIESGGTLRILDVLFVLRDPETSELVALDAHGRGQGSLVAPLLGFRLDPGERRRLSERALRSEAHGGVLRRLGEGLEPGAAVAAVLVEHVWMAALDDAIAQTGGTPLANEMVAAAGIGELGADVIAAAGQGASHETDDAAERPPQ
jgi:hypothetical protein